MEYITSRGFLISKNSKEFEDDFRFHLWQRRLWPYEELLIGDIVYWYETPSQSIVWKSKLSNVVRFEYKSKQEAKEKLVSQFGDFDESQDYFVNGPTQGYCIGLKVKAIEKLSLPKPSGLRFPQQGWLRVDAGIAKTWLDNSGQIEDVVLDDIVPDGSLIDKIRRINEIMNNVSPQRISSVVSHTIRKDTKLVKALKSLCDYRCQFPDCDVRIQKSDGGYYIEVAHIQPVKSGGKSIIGNLLVLCPNHHKEFDFGDLIISEQNESLVKGALNGRKFEITMPTAR